ncbi:hypothetical protein [Streptomyces chartreusis]|uniref:hypothetical protein n=1 Tax=Streptomyces chartreusis TaxID=1969 RepID=UPI0036AEF7CD
MDCRWFSKRGVSDAYTGGIQLGVDGGDVLLTGRATGPHPRLESPTVSAARTDGLSMTEVTVIRREIRKSQSSLASSDTTNRIASKISRRGRTSSLPAVDLRQAGNRNNSSIIDHSALVVSDGYDSDTLGSHRPVSGDQDGDGHFEVDLGADVREPPAIRIRHRVRGTVPMIRLRISGSFSRITVIS